MRKRPLITARKEPYAKYTLYSDFTQVAEHISTFIAEFAIALADKARQYGNTSPQYDRVVDEYEDKMNHTVYLLKLSDHLEALHQVPEIKVKIRLSGIRDEIGGYSLRDHTIFLNPLVFFDAIDQVSPILGYAVFQVDVIKGIIQGTIESTLAHEIQHAWQFAKNKKVFSLPEEEKTQHLGNFYFNRHLGTRPKNKIHYQQFQQFQQSLQEKQQMFGLPSRANREQIEDYMLYSNHPEEIRANVAGVIQELKRGNNILSLKNMLSLSPQKYATLLKIVGSTSPGKDVLQFASRKLASKLLKEVYMEIMSYQDDSQNNQEN